MKIHIFFLLFGFFCFSKQSNAQVVDKELRLYDDIQVDVKNTSLSIKGDTAIVELFLISYQSGAREFKLNSFASGIVDADGKTYLYDTMQLGKVLVNVDDRQNYIHYLLEEDEPIKFIVKTAGWKKQWGKPQQFKLAFEDREEEGKFIEVIVDL